MPPKVIVLEGPDGCGKTAHTDLLADALLARGISVRSFHHAPPPRGASRFEAAMHYASQRQSLLRMTQCDVIVADRWRLSTEVLGDALRALSTSPADPLRAESIALRRLAEVERSALPDDGVLVMLHAPSDVLDARLAARGTPATDLDRAIREVYARHYEGLLLTDGPRGEVAAQLAAVVLVALRDRCGFRRAVQVIREGRRAEEGSP